MGSPEGAQFFRIPPEDCQVVLGIFGKINPRIEDDLVVFKPCRLGPLQSLSAKNSESVAMISG